MTTRMRKTYIPPLCEIATMENAGHIMLYFSVHDEETEIVGAKEQNLGDDFFGGNLWNEDDED